MNEAIRKNLEEDLLALIDEVIKMPEATLAAVPDEYFMSILSQINSEESIQEQLEAFREAGTTRAEVITTQKEMANAILYIKENVGYSSMSDIRRKRFDMIVDSIMDGIEILIHRYDTYDVRVDYEEIHPNAKKPEYAHEYDAGADVTCPVDFVLPAKSFGVIVPTGLKVNIPKGWKIEVLPKSGISHNTKLRIANAPGQIDYGYYQEMGIIYDNFGDEDYEIKAGSKIAQLAVDRRYRAFYNKKEKIETQDSRENANGEAGFGSSDASDPPIDIT